jgi:hypothetical protein
VVHLLFFFAICECTRDKDIVNTASRSRGRDGARAASGRARPGLGCVEPQTHGRFFWLWIESEMTLLTLLIRLLTLVYLVYAAVEAPRDRGFLWIGAVAILSSWVLVIVLSWALTLRKHLR